MKCSLDFKKEIKEEVIEYLELNASYADKTYAINPKIVTKSDIKYINDYYKDEVVKKINDTTITIEPSLDLLVEKQEIYHKALAMVNKAPERKIYNDPSEYKKAFAKWSINNGEYYFFNKAEANIKYKQLSKYYGEDYVRKPYEISKRHYKVYVLKPILEEEYQEQEAKTYIRTAFGKDEELSNLLLEEQERDYAYDYPAYERKQKGKDLLLKQQYFYDKDILKSREMLERISNGNHSLNILAKKLLNYGSINYLNIELINDENQNFTGRYDSVKNNIKINTAHGFRGKGGEATILHEILHAYSWNIIRNNQKVQDELVELYYHTVQQTPENKRWNPKDHKNTFYALSNVDEFFVALFTDAEFIAYLKTLKPLRPERANLLDDFIHWVLSILNIKKDDITLYQEAYSVAVNTLELAKKSKPQTNIDALYNFYYTNDYFQYNRQEILNKQQANDLKTKGVVSSENRETYVAYTEKTRLEFSKSYVDNQGLTHYLFSREYDSNRNIVSTAQSIARVIDEDCQ